MFLILLAVATMLTAQAQEKKNYVGGSLGAWFDKTVKMGETAKTTTLELAPEVGRWFNERVAMGIGIGYTHTYTEYEFTFNTPDPTTANALMVSPYVRYRFFHKNIVSLFLDGGFGIGFVDEKGTENSQTLWEVGLRPGIMLHLSERVSLLGHFGFLGARGVVDAETFGGLRLDAGDINIGFVWNF